MRIVSKQFSDSAATCKPRPVSEGEAGLTLVEMLVVLVIIAIVATMVTMNVINRPDQAKVTTTQANLASISTVLKTYRLDNGDYPTTQQGLKALVEKSSIPPVPTSYPDGGYLSNVPLDDQGRPVDAWGHAYVYEATSSGFALKSLGKDGKPGGEGIDADIVAKR